jgi:hypothetical protein
LRSILLGGLVAGLVAFFEILGENSGAGIDVASTQIPVLSYVLLLLTVLLINPFCRLIRIIRPFSIAEVLIVFVMGMVSCGIPVYGLTMQLLPITGGLYYKDWNTDQSQWNRYVAPYVDEYYFLSEPGIQVAARDYRQALDKQEDLQKVQNAAAAVESRKAALKAAEEKAGDKKSTDLAVLGATQKVKDAEAQWQTVLARTDPPSSFQIDDVLKTFPAQIADAEKLAKEKKGALDDLEKRASVKIELFRRGLTEKQQAYPGIFPLPGDDASSYFGRLRRLNGGLAALAKVKEAAQQFEAKPEAESAAMASAAAAPAMQQAIETLTPLSDKTEIESKIAVLSADRDKTTAQLGAIDSELADLNRKKRAAGADELSALNSKIHDLTMQRGRQANARADLELRLKNRRKQSETVGRIKAAMTELEELQKKLPSGELNCGQAKAQIAAIIQEFPSFDASYRRYFLGDVPWAHWWPVLWRWLLIAALTYSILIAFNVLIFRQWAHNEKLIYPLAELPMILGGKNDEKPGWVPEIFRSGLFWVGLLTSGLTLGWNLMAKTQLIAGIAPLDLDNYWRPYIEGTWLKALLPSTQSQIFFTMIGLSFFTPAKTSFSLWFFRVLYMIQIVVLVALGYGENESSFPRDWHATLNFGTAEGQGAMIVFAAVALYTCRKYLLCAFAPKLVEGLESDEQRELRISSFVFLSGSLFLILMLWQGMGANLFYTVFVLGGLLLLTIGLVRAVAEGGLLGFQAFAGPFHFIRSFFGFDKSWSSPTLFAPLMVFHSIFFLDIKTFIAPSIANGLKVREDLKMERLRFHFCVVLAIAAAVLVSIGISLMMSYDRGANQMEGWFFSMLPKEFFDEIKTINQLPSPASASMTLWTLTGAAVMGLLLYFRQYFFWLPHPIGMIMLINPIMRVYWFPIFLGWLAKSLVTRYGSRDTYRHVRALFIGFIVGELTIVAISLYLSYTMNIAGSAIDLNRNN